MTEGGKYARKGAFLERMQSYLKEYPSILLVTADNVGSFQMQQIRIALRGRGVLLMGKNTMMRKAMRAVVEENEQLEPLMAHVKGNVGFVFTHEDVGEIRDILLENTVPALARSGAISPCDVWIEPGPTGMEPNQTASLQVLGIATKITRGQIEILSRVHLLEPGQKVGASEAALLQRLDIRPFRYGLTVGIVYDNGSIYDSSVLDITQDDVVSKFLEGVQEMAAVSLAINHPTLASIPHSLVNGLKDLIAQSIATEYTFAESEKAKAYLADPTAFAAAAPAAAAGGAAEETKEEEKKEESESDSDMGMGLFD